MKSGDTKIFGTLEGKYLLGFIVARLSYYPPIYLQEKYGFN